MGRASGFSNRFNAGELSPDAWADSDLQQHAHGCALAYNFVGLVAGPLARRPGFWDAGAIADEATPGRLIAFKRSFNDAVMLEFGDLTVRVWSSDYTPLMDGPDQVEFVSPYAADQLAGLRSIQTGSVLIFTHIDSTVPTRSLTRAEDGTWSFSLYDFVNGPWRAENDGPITISADKLRGNVTLVASAALFTPAHVGSLFRLRETDGSAGNMRTWADKGGTTADKWSYYEMVQFNGRVYRNTSAAATVGRNNPPIHTSGVVSDGTTNWEYIHDGAGIVLVTGYTNSTHVSATVIRTLPGEVVSTETGYKVDDFATTPFLASTFWAENAYSSLRGFPTALPTIREERAVFGGSTSEPDKLRASRTAGFKTTEVDMTPGLGTGRVVDTDAVSAYVGDQGGRLTAFVSASYLLGLSTDGEQLVAGAGLDQPLSPSSLSVKTISDYGSADVDPVKAHGSVLFVAAGAEDLRGIILGPDQSLTPRDFSVLAGHITSRGLAQIAWTKQDNIVWARLADGGLAALVYHAEQQVEGWTSQGIGAGNWTVESLAVLPGINGRDALWVIAHRFKDGSHQRRIMVLSRRQDAMRQDAARLYEGVAVNAVTGLDYLENEWVLMRAGDGAGAYAEFRVQVSGGVAALPNGLTSPEIVVGLAYLSRFESLPLDLGGPGTTMGRKQRLTKGLLTVTGVACRAGQISADADPFSIAGQMDPVKVPRLTAETTYRRPRRFTEDVTFGGSADRDPRVVVEHDGVFDLVINALRPGAEIN